MAQDKKPNVMKSFLIAVVVLVVAITPYVLLGLAKLPFWPFMYLVFFFIVIAKLDVKALPNVVIGGAIGMLVGFSSQILGYFTGDALVATVGYLVIILVYITFVVDGRLGFFTNPFPSLMLTILTTGIAELTAGAVVPAFISYAIGVVVLFGVAALLKSMAKKKAVAAQVAG